MFINTKEKKEEEKEDKNTCKIKKI